MTRSSDNRPQMLHQLAAFKKKHGHCNVPTGNLPVRATRQLGTWVAAQRYKRKIGELSEAHIKQLDRLGFVWSVSERAWEKMFQSLAAFKKRYGHCDVPAKWPENPSLAIWVQRQRLRKKKGRVSSERTKQLEEFGFSWSIYRGGKRRASPVQAEPFRRDSEPSEEKLYSLGNGNYVQYRGNGRKPKQLQKYIAHHNGGFPPHIQLPRGPVNFYLGERYIREERICWKGKGRLPDEVLDYVRQNGTLPGYD